MRFSKGKTCDRRNACQICFTESISPYPHQVPELYAAVHVARTLPTDTFQVSRIYLGRYTETDTRGGTEAGRLVRRMCRCATTHIPVIIPPAEDNGQSKDSETRDGSPPPDD